MNFDEYLISKKIDSAAFKNAEPERWQEWNIIFVELSPASFTAQKLYLINPVRRKYQLKINLETKSQEIALGLNSPDQKPPSSKPVFRPKIK